MKKNIRSNVANPIITRYVYREAILWQDNDGNLRWEGAPHKNGELSGFLQETNNTFKIILPI